MLLRFVFGLIVGSFLNVLAWRYDPGKFLFHKRVVYGRSRCAHCAKTLAWWELLPVLSYLFLRGKCSGCKKRISLRYPIVEIISGLIFLFVPVFSMRFYGAEFGETVSIIWALVFLSLLVMSLIDIRLKLIPDEINVFVILLSALLLIMGDSPSFIGPYSILFGLAGNKWLNHVFSAVMTSAFMFLVHYFTRGRGLGFGDVKLSFALGFLFGWPAGMLLVLLSFVLGALASAPLLLSGKKTMKSILPLGPFIALSAAAMFLFGNEMARFYFGTLTGFSAEFLGL